MIRKETCNHPVNKKPWKFAIGILAVVLPLLLAATDLSIAKGGHLFRKPLTDLVKKTKDANKPTVVRVFTDWEQVAIDYQDGETVLIIAMGEDGVCRREYVQMKKRDVDPSTIQ